VGHEGNNEWFNVRRWSLCFYYYCKVIKKIMLERKYLKQLKESVRIEDSDFYLCEVTGISTKAIAFHHVVKKSHGGSDDRDNLISCDWYVHSTFHDGYRNFKRYLAELKIYNAKELYLKMGGKRTNIEE